MQRREAQGLKLSRVERGYRSGERRANLNITYPFLELKIHYSLYVSWDFSMQVAENERMMIV